MLKGTEGRVPIFKQDQATKDNKKNVSVRGEVALLAGILFYFYFFGEGWYKLFESDHFHKF